MSDAAVIAQVAAAGGDFRDAAPGHVFQLYLPMWRQDWSLDKTAKSEAARRSTRMPGEVVKLSLALRQRQAALAQAAGALTRRAISTSPFATGLGNEHPIENGFAFLTPYGLPYLAGSGIKGVLRRSMQELGADQPTTFTKEVIEALFGVEEVNQPEDARRGAIDVWDCYPQPASDKLVVEIMTPHLTKYYEGKESPHDAGQPVPVPFLAVPAGSQFDFHVVCNERRLPESLRGGGWQALLGRAFDHAFDWLGFGAKTSVGYGAMAENPEVRARRLAEAATAQALADAQVDAARRAALSPADQAWDLAQPVLAEFRAAFEKAKAAGAFNPSGPFNEARLKFIKTVGVWTEARSRQSAGELLEQTATKAWGQPSKKERLQELRAVIADLRASP